MRVAAFSCAVVVFACAVAVPRTVRAQSLAVAGIVAVLALVNIWPLWRGTVYGANLLRDENIPSYYKQAAAALDRKPHDTRVLEIPGADFAAYRWGQTVDPVTPGLMDRPYVARELIPYGSPPSADLLNAFDRRVQENTLDPVAVSPQGRTLLPVASSRQRLGPPTRRPSLRPSSRS